MQSCSEVTVHMSHAVPLQNTERQLTTSSPEYKDEEHEEHAEGSYIVHSLHQHHKLAAQCGHETHQLQHPQETESPQHREPPICLADDLPDAMAPRGTREYKGQNERQVNEQKRERKNNANPSFHLYIGSKYEGIRRKICLRKTELEAYTIGMYLYVESCVSPFRWTWHCMLQEWGRNWSIKFQKGRFFYHTLNMF